MDVSNINNTAVLNKNIGVQPLPQKPKVEPVQQQKREVDTVKQKIVNLNDALEKLSRAAGLFNKRLRFSVDDELNRVIVKIIDEKTDKVIKQIPPQEVLNFVAELRKMIGIFVDKQK